MNLPNLNPVDGSSNVAATGHQGTTLFVGFHRQGKKAAVYRYEGVTAKEYKEMLGADSIGQHFHRHIKPRFAGIKIGD